MSKIECETTPSL